MVTSQSNGFYAVCGDARTGTEHVGAGVVGVKVKEGEEDHFAADQDGRHAELNVVVGEFGAGVDGAGVVEDGKDDLDGVSNYNIGVVGGFGKEE